MNRPGEPGPASGRDGAVEPARPITVEIVAATLVFGGLFGATQLLFGDFVITGSLPAKGPILGVAAVLYVASVVLGVAIRTGRAWLPTLNLAGLFAIVYLAALGHAVALLLGVAHGVAAIMLFRARAWFGAMARWRHAPVETRASASRPTDQARTWTSRRGGSRRPSGRR